VDGPRPPGPIASAAYNIYPSTPCFRKTTTYLLQCPHSVRSRVLGLCNGRMSVRPSVSLSVPSIDIIGVRLVCCILSAGAAYQLPVDICCRRPRSEAHARVLLRPDERDASRRLVFNNSVRYKPTLVIFVSHHTGARSKTSNGLWHRTQFIPRNQLQ